MSGSNTSYTVGNATTKFLYLKCFTHGVIFAMSSHLVCLQISTYLHDLLRYVDLIAFSYIYIYTSILSSTAFTCSYVFLVESFELSECDRTLISLCLLSQTLSIQIICILLKLSNVFYASLSAEDTETNIKSFLMIHLYCWNPEKPEQLSDIPGGRGNVGQLWVCCMLATCPSDVNRQGHQRNCVVPHTYL